MTKYLVLFISCILLLLSCKKEVGRKNYLLSYTFSSGEQVSLVGKIYEKYKKKHGTVDPNAMIFAYTDDLHGYQTYILYKTKESKLTGTWIQFFNLKNFAFGNGSNIFAQGSIALEGNYKSPYRKVTVESGTFKFYWANAEDYGMNDTILTGTWSLKRE